MPNKYKINEKLFYNENITLEKCKAKTINNSERKCVVLYKKYNENKLQYELNFNDELKSLEKSLIPQEMQAYEKPFYKIRTEILFTQPVVKIIKMKRKILYGSLMFALIPNISKNNKQMWWMYRYVEDKEYLIIIPMNENEIKQITKLYNKMYEIYQLTD